MYRIPPVAVSVAPQWLMHFTWTLIHRWKKIITDLWIFIETYKKITKITWKLWTWQKKILCECSFYLHVGISSENQAILSMICLIRNSHRMCSVKNMFLNSLRNIYIGVSFLTNLQTSGTGDTGFPMNFERNFKNTFLYQTPAVAVLFNERQDCLNIEFEKKLKNNQFEAIFEPMLCKSIALFLYSGNFTLVFSPISIVNVM